MVIFFPLVLCIAPYSMLKASQQELQAFRDTAIRM